MYHHGNKRLLGERRWRGSSCPLVFLSRPWRDVQPSMRASLLLLQSPTTGQLLTLHNLYYLQQLCSEMHQSIKEKRFAEFVCDFLQRLYPRQTDGREADGLQHASKRRRLADARSLQDTTATIPKDSGAGAGTKPSTNGTDACTSADSAKGNLDGCGHPRPPMWVRDALLASGIDISHMYSSFDPTE